MSLVGGRKGDLTKRRAGLVRDELVDWLVKCLNKEEILFFDF